VTAFDTVLNRIKTITSNRGHSRVAILLYAAWVAFALWIVWTPLPLPPTAHDLFGGSHVAACGVFPTRDCVEVEQLKVGSIALVCRIAFVFLTPMAGILILMLAATIFEWVKEGYKDSN
jgi:Na+/H+ antiporter NhaD/arsenite permease-like protein